MAFLVPTLILSVSYGFESLYIARSLVRIQMIVCALLIMHIMYGFKIQHILRNVLPMIISALVMGVAGYLLQQVNSSMICQYLPVTYFVLFKQIMFSAFYL